MRLLRHAMIPAVAALAALFLLLPTRGADARVGIVATEGGYTYQPAKVSIEPGERVAFENRTSTTHTATCVSCPPDDAWDTGDIQPGETVFLTVDEAGTYEFVCRYHGQTHGLRGTLVVGASGGEEPGAGDPQPSPGATGS